MARLLVLALACLMIKNASAAKCLGKANLYDFYSTSCQTNSEDGKITEEQSCLVRERATKDRSCTADSCTEINIKVNDVTSTYNTDGYDYTWSFASCFKQEMPIRVCFGYSDGTTTTTPTTTTTTTPTTTTTTTPTTTTTTTPTTTTTTTPTTTTTTTPTTTTTTTPTTTTTTATTTTTLPHLSGCFTGTVTFTASACAKEKKIVELTQEGSSLKINFDVQVVGCCSGEKCKVDAGAGTLCKFGMDDEDYESRCTGGCFAAVIKSGVDMSTFRGCLSDLDKSYISLFPKQPTCSDYEVGECHETGDDYVCARCCKDEKCNTMKTKDEITKKDEESGSETMLPSLVMVTMAAISLFFAK